MQTKIKLNKKEVEGIVQDHLQSKMSLYNAEPKVDSIWSSDGTLEMTVTFDERSDQQ
ncbi:MAG: hypothetical protein AAFX90_10020 [Pseudomonadota bacterium]